MRTGTCNVILRYIFQARSIKFFDCVMYLMFLDPLTGPLTAILPLPRLLWGPGTTATSSQGSPATKPKVQLWTSTYTPAQTHTFIHKLPLFFCPHVLIWSIQSHFDRMNHFFSFFSSPPWFEIFNDPVDRLKVKPFEWNVLLSAVMSPKEWAIPAVYLQMNPTLRQNAFYLALK